MAKARELSGIDYEEAEEMEVATEAIQLAKSREVTELKTDTIEAKGTYVALTLNTFDSLEREIKAIQELFAAKNYTEVSELIKKNLQLCYDVLNHGKYRVQEYKLLMILGDMYLAKDNWVEYPKALAIYHYLKVLVAKTFEITNKDQHLLELKLRI